MTVSGNGYSGPVTRSNVYRTAGGTILRISESEDGALKVERLQGEEWIAGRVGMAGLRRASTTTRLSASEVRSLPA